MPRIFARLQLGGGIFPLIELVENEPTVAQRRRRYTISRSLVLELGGGIDLHALFLHLAPEVRYPCQIRVIHASHTGTGGPITFSSVDGSMASTRQPRSKLTCGLPLR